MEYVLELASSQFCFSLLTCFTYNKWELIYSGGCLYWNMEWNSGMESGMKW